MSEEHQSGKSLIQRWRAAFRDAMPHGYALPPDVWEKRHNAILVLLWCHVPFLIAVSVIVSTHSVSNDVTVILPITSLALMAKYLPGDKSTRRHRRIRSLLAVLGLFTCSAVLVHLCNGIIESHFHFFVMISVVAFYEDWAAFGLAVAFMLFHHAFLKVIAPNTVVFYHDGPVTDALASWRWAGIHAFFLAAAAIANLILWRLNERSREQATEQAERRERVVTIARTLAESLIPENFPEIESIQADAAYLPGEGAIGGDWYDLIPLEDGRVGVVLGDVAGHGVKAASLTARLRHTLAAYALDGLEPAEVMARVERALTGTSTATCVYAIIDIENEKLTISCAGHLPPLLRYPDGSASYAKVGQSVPLADLGIPHVQDTIDFPTGTTLLLFSDGLVERRRETIDVGLERLRDDVAGGQSDPEQLCKKLPTRILEEGGVHEDDVTMVAVRTLPAAVTV